MTWQTIWTKNQLLSGCWALSSIFIFILLIMCLILNKKFNLSNRFLVAEGIMIIMLQLFIAIIFKRIRGQ